MKRKVPRFIIVHKGVTYISMEDTLDHPTYKGLGTMIKRSRDLK